MKIKTKIRIATSLLAILPSITTAIVIGYGATNASQISLEKQITNQLAASRDMSARNIESYFKTLRGQIKTLSSSPSIIDAMEDFTRGFSRHRMYLRMTTPEKDQRQSIEKFYKDQFLPKYNRINGSERNKIELYLENLDSHKLALQYSYISSNTQPLGQKHKYLRSQFDSTYDGSHAYHHPSFKQYLQEFGLYDIFLIDNLSGNIVYSVFKEVDFATSLIDGAFVDSELAKVFIKAKNAKNKDAVFISELARYNPSYDSFALFIASPIFDQNNQSIGVIAFQIPIEKLNSVMTHDSKWKEVGLGATGETFLLNEQGLMQSNSRLMTEHPDLFLNTIKTQANTSQQNLDVMAQRSSSVGILKVDSSASRKAIQGETSFAKSKNYLGLDVISAFKPLSIEGLNWFVLSEMTVDEAFASVTLIKSSIAKQALIASLLALMVGLFAGFVISNGIVRPLNKTVSLLKNIAQGDGDLSKRLRAKEKDELGDLSHWFNVFIEKLQTMFTSINDNVDQLVKATSSLNNSTDQTRLRTSQQTQEVQLIASALTEMSASSIETLKNVKNSANNIETTSQASDEGVAVIDQSCKSITLLADEVRSTLKVINKLNNDSDEISGVLVVIESIAEQTNLLALNAAIEAARAGESGRGFAVVADEVRSLAQRTQESTQQIQDIINRLQSGSSNAVTAMEKSKKRADNSVDEATRANSSFENINLAIVGIKDISDQIATTSEQQCRTIEEVERNITTLSALSIDTNNESEIASSASKQVTELANRIKDELSAYKI